MDADMTGIAALSDATVSRDVGSAHGTRWTMRAVTTEDVEVLADLRATVMRADLIRLGRFDEHRVRQRLRDTLSTRHTSVLMIEGRLAGCITVRPAEDGRWLEHFYLAPQHQGRGLGSAILRTVLERADVQGVAVRLNVLHGSAARRLYERHGFVAETQGPIDVFMVRPPAGNAH